MASMQITPADSKALITLEREIFMELLLVELCAHKRAVVDAQSTIIVTFMHACNVTKRAWEARAACASARSTLQYRVLHDGLRCAVSGGFPRVHDRFDRGRLCRRPG